MSPDARALMRLVRQDIRANWDLYVAVGQVGHEDA